MTLRHLRWTMLSVVVAYALAIALGVWLRRPFLRPPSGAYTTYKDLLPLVIAIPAAYLAFAFQRRSSYLQALRGLWTHMVGAVSAALAYTDTPWPSRDQQQQVLHALSVAIEEVRGVFKNVRAEGAPDGWYPFEPVKQIYAEIRDLGHGGAATAERRAAARARISDMWKRSRTRLLSEFDRDEPTRHHAGYAPGARVDAPPPDVR